MRAFRLAYDGRPYHGFQRQPDVPTVEGALFSALRSLDVCSGEPASYSAAGRTDAGASAVAQTVAFECPDWCLPRALNAELPGSIRAWASADVTPAFHATRDASSRAYTYYLYAPELDDSLVHAGAERLSGPHDYRALTPDETGTERELTVDVRRCGDYLVVVARAGGFPRQLVRRLVSLLRAVGSGDADLGAVDRVLSADRDEPAGVQPAPAYPLVLTDVAYDVSFAPDPSAVGSAQEVFRERRMGAAVRARVMDRILGGLEPPNRADPSDPAGCGPQGHSR